MPSLLFDSAYYISNTVDIVESVLMEPLYILYVLLVLLINFEWDKYFVLKIYHSLHDHINPS